jgi:hypothetical protein
MTLERRARRLLVGLFALHFYGCTADSNPGPSADVSTSTGGASTDRADASTSGKGGASGSAGAGGARATGSGGRPSGAAGVATSGGSSSIAGAGGVPANGGSSSNAGDGGTKPGTGGGGATGVGGVSTGGANGSDGGDNDGGTGTPPSTTYADFTGVCAYVKDDFPALQAIGIQNARFDHPTADLITTARTYGIEILPIVDYGFTDLSGQSSDKYPPLPENRATWAKRMVDTYRTMQNPPPVIEVWNEPWNTGFWPPTPDAAAYLELVKAFAKEAWAVWPKETLLVSADEGEKGYAFRTKLLDADADGFLNDPRILPTTHNYVEARTPTQVTSQPCSYDLNRFDCAWNDFNAHGHPNPQVWITEFGWESSTSGGTDQVTPVSEALQAQNTIDALGIFRKSGHVAKAFAFLFHRNDPWNYNWLRPDNSQKPICQSVKSLIATRK